MSKKLFVALFAFLALAATTRADALPQENWQTMNPTVQVVSYKGVPSGHVNGIASGSGTVISPDGLVLTNHHVIFDEVEQRPFDAFQICITFEVQQEPLCNYTARLVANNKELDVALLQINRQDVFGKRIQNLHYLEATDTGEPQEKQEVEVLGYPASGGETITITKGQISGFDTFNGYKYFKTDTDFDHGSSGGTVLDQSGHFIGIPTYIRTYAENVGYFLNLREALGWIQKHENDKMQVNEKAEAELTADSARLFQANRELRFTSTNYPYFKLQAPDGWRFFQISDTGLMAAQKNVNEGVGINIHIEHYPFPIDQAYLDRLDQEFIEIRKASPDFKKETVTFAGQEAIQITYTSYNQKNTILYIPYGDALVGISYSINLDHAKKQTDALAPVLNSFQLVGQPERDPGLPNPLKYEEPAFTISAFDGFRLQKPMNGDEAELLARGVQTKNVEGEFRILYPFVTQDDRQLGAKERLQEAVKALSDKNAKLIFKKENVVLDGLKGFLYAYEYEGSLYQQIRKKLVIRLADGSHEFEITYDDLADAFDRNLPTIAQMLRSFAYNGTPNPGKGKTDFGVLGQRFKDIQYHRFAAAISELADKNMVSGYRDGTFRPEKFASQNDALTLIVKSKQVLSQEQGLGKKVSFRPASFQPYQPVTLTQALEWIVKVYEVPVWQGKTAKDFKRYMDKAYELDWLPSGVGDPSGKLTRGELSAIVDNVYNQAK